MDNDNTANEPQVQIGVKQLPFSIRFCNPKDTKDVWGAIRFDEEKQKLTFDGKLDESAQIFFEVLCKLFNNWHALKYGEDRK